MRWSPWIFLSASRLRSGTARRCPTVGASAVSATLRLTGCARRVRLCTVANVTTDATGQTEDRRDLLAVLLSLTGPDGCPSVRLARGMDGTWHTPGCGHDGEIDPGVVAPTSVLLGLDGRLCQWAAIPPAYVQAGAIVRDYSQLETLRVSDAARPSAEDAAGWARAIMRQRRQLNQLSSHLRQWAELNVSPEELDPSGTDSTPGSDTDHPEAGSLGVPGVQCCASCSRYRRTLGSIFADLHTSLAGSWQDMVRSDASRALLSAVTADRRPVTMALEHYQPRTDQSIDGDVADAVVAAFTASRQGGRVALRLPLGLAGYIAIHRQPGGLSEVDRDASTPEDVLEIAMVLWEPDGQGPYRRWPDAVRAARLLR